MLSGHVDLNLLVDVMVIVLLAVAIPVAILVQRELRRVKSSKEGIELCLQEFTKSTEVADVTARELQRQMKGADRSVNELVARGEELKEDLKFMIERAEKIAGNLESGLTQARAKGGVSQSVQESLKQKTPVGISPYTIPVKSSVGTQGGMPKSMMRPHKPQTLVNKNTDLDRNTKQEQNSSSGKTHPSTREEMLSALKSVR